MKALILALMATAAGMPSCEAGPQRKATRDSARQAPAPGVKKLPQDSPERGAMPVLQTDTARQSDMPVVAPPKNVQPK